MNNFYWVVNLQLNKKFYAKIKYKIKAMKS